MSASNAFRPSRADGRSDRQVVYDLVHDAEPGTVFSYDVLTAALQVDVPTPIRRHRIYTAVTAANRSLLRQDHRLVSVVRGTGYRMLRADEHLPVALIRKERAETQVARGIETLRGVRWADLDTEQRKVTEGVLLVMSGIYQNMQAQERRQARQDAAIDRLIQRVERLEGGKEENTLAGQG